VNQGEGNSGSLFLNNSKNLLRDDAFALKSPVLNLVLQIKPLHGERRGDDAVTLAQSRTVKQASQQTQYPHGI
jgi:hypothetical protein